MSNVNDNNNGNQVTVEGSVTDNAQVAGRDINNLTIILAQGALPLAERLAGISLLFSGMGLTTPSSSLRLVMFGVGVTLIIAALAIKKNLIPQR